MKDVTHFKVAGYKISIQLITLILSLLGLILAGLVYYQYKLLDQTLSRTEKENTNLTGELEVAKDTIDYLSEETRNKQVTIDSFNGQIRDIGSTVGTLTKLAQTDKELLKKYSKVYFLNENYIPKALMEIEEQYMFKQANSNFQIHADVWPYLKNLLEAVKGDGVELLVASAYRSFGTQAVLKNGYVFVYGAGTANQFSADQGYSEHQLGTALDFTTPSAGASFSKFKTEPGFKWLEDNAYKYGFTLSYPEGNAYYKFEPWHWRFVGIDLATRLHDEGKYFYDMDQREIDVYLIKLFD